MSERHTDGFTPDDSVEGMRARHALYLMLGKPADFCARCGHVSGTRHHRFLKHHEYRACHECECRAGQDFTTCPIKSCDEPCYYQVDNEVDFGEQSLIEAWSGWCPVHGEFGRAGSGPVVFLPGEPGEAVYERQPR